MRGRIVAIGIVVALLAGRFLLPSSAQDDTDARLAQLETRVAALETAIAHPNASASPATGSAFAFEGTGQGIIDPFDIAEGTYRVRWSCDADPSTYPALTLQPVGGGSGFFYISIGPDDPNPTEQLLPIRSDVRIAGQVECAGAWAVTIATMA